MSLWRITTKRSVMFNGVSIEPGMSVEIPSQTNGWNNPMHITNNREINNAFKRVYGIDLERAGLLSPNYLRIEMVGGDSSNEEHRDMTKKETLFAMLLQMFS